MLTPAFATSTRRKKRPPAVSLSFDPVSSFTPANADPKLAAALAGKSLSLTDFKFTPAPAKGRPSQVRVAIRARVTAPAQTAVARSSAPTAAVTALDSDQLQPRRRGRLAAVRRFWRRLQGQGCRSGDRRPRDRGRRRQLFAQQRFTGRVAVGAERATDSPLPALRQGDNYSLDAGGSYSLSRRIAVTGGVRYNIERDRLSALQDDRRDSQAVYVGTAFKF